MYTFIIRRAILDNIKKILSTALEDTSRMVFSRSEAKFYCVKHSIRLSDKFKFIKSKYELRTEVMTLDIGLATNTSSKPYIIRVIPTNTLEDFIFKTCCYKNLEDATRFNFISSLDIDESSDWKFILESLRNNIVSEELMKNNNSPRAKAIRLLTNLKKDTTDALVLIDKELDNVSKGKNINYNSFGPIGEKLTYNGEKATNLYIERIGRKIKDD